MLLFRSVAAWIGVVKFGKMGTSSEILIAVVIRVFLFLEFFRCRMNLCKPHKNPGSYTLKALNEAQI